ncbi:MAG: hypothetical protein EA376_04855 [Phycisphaeraceae bacterium]|nr:MAG: hypothetical protein EA376_04855 [Phycisphaeraceae bacterium]
MTSRRKISHRVRIAAALLAVAGAAVCMEGASAQRIDARNAHTDRWQSRLDELRARERALEERAGAGEAALELSERLLDRIAADGADLAALYGVPTREQVERARSLAIESQDAARRARALIEAEIRAVESHADFAADRDMQDQRSRLAVEMLEFRRPLAEARAALLLAALEDSASRRRALAQSVAALLQALDLREPAWEARRLVMLGGASLLNGDGAEAALDAFSECLELIGPEESRVYVEASLGRGIAAMQTQGAGAARAAVRAAMARPPFTPRDLTSAPWRVAAADTLFRIGAREAGRAASRPAWRDAMTRACEGYVELLTRSEEGVESIRPVVYAKLTELGWPDDPAELPTVAALALSDRAVRTGEPDRAIALLDDLSARPDVALGPLAGEALWEHARVLLDAAMSGTDASIERRMRAMGSLVRIGRDHEEWRGAADAVETACRLGLWLLNRAPERLHGRVETLLIEALQVATQRYEDLPSINDWRLELGRLVDDAMGERALRAIPAAAPAQYVQAQSILIGHMLERMDAQEGAARREIAQAMLERVHKVRVSLRDVESLEGEAGKWLAALDRPATVAMVELGELERATRLAASSPDAGVGRGVFVRLCRMLVEAELRDDLDEARRIAGHVAPIGAIELERVSAADDIDAATDRWITLHQARALTLTGRGAEAAALLEALEARGVADRSVRFWRADAMRQAGDEAGAFAIWRELAGALEAAEVYDEIFWRSWTRMLSALADRNQDGARTATIRREAGRLRALDDSLGGRPHRGRIENVIRRLDDRSN